VQVIVRGSPDGMCASASTGVNLNFAEKDVTGAIYYWKSTVSANGTGGQIWRKDFASTNPEEKITDTGSLGGTCFGCHELSRDGKRMTVNADDDDSDDEYGDVQSALIDLTTKMFIGGTDPNNYMGQPAGFQTFSPDHTIYLGSSGDGSGANYWGGGGMGLPNGFFAWNGDTAAPFSPVTAGTAMQRPTMPDWSADGSSVVYVIPDHIGDSSYTDDDHVFGGSLWTIPYTLGAFAKPQLLLQSAGENNYYPGYSPDGMFVVFNRVDQQPSAAIAANDSFANPNARVWVLPVGGNIPSPAPIDCAKLNATGALSNSWPRWSPFIQTYKGNQLLWVTFSSTRDYGVQIKNQSAGKVQCYPPDDVENPPPNDSHGMPFPGNCMQPQIWMAAINLTTAGEFNNNPTDPSFPAFWLPFQDPTTHNHTAQWTTTIVNPSPSPNPCIGTGLDCTMDPNNCCMGICTFGGTCGIP
jgi:hypothetical protein